MIDPKRVLGGPSASEDETEAGVVLLHPAPHAAFRFADAKTLLGDALQAWYQHNAPRLGASLAFYTILSLAPLLIVVIAVASLISGRQAAESQIVWQIQNLAGTAGAEVTRQLIAGAHEPASGVLATTLGLLALFLGATAVVAELRDALNTIWDIPMQTRPWSSSVIRILRERILSFVMVLGAGFLLLVSLIVNAFLAAVGSFFKGVLPMPEYVLQGLTSLLSFVVIAGLFALIYKVMPDVDLKWRDVAPGAALTSLLFSLGKLVIGLYLGKTSLGSSYGAAGSLMVLLVWVYYSAQVFLLGAEFTQVFSRRYGRGARLGPVKDLLVASTHGAPA
ncbi:MAG: YihY/virulence factor BrkB family protein [Acidobacteriia bacterium]|nr:YihY/virulence factor BrkB family protein [Terriglobia bacterium]